MNKKIRFLILACALVLLCLFISSCSSKDVYGDYDEDGYTVSVKFDANGSYFGSSGNLFATDTYSISGLKVNENGMKELYIVKPDDGVRGEENKLEIERAAMKGYFFAGWYTEMTEAKDKDGNILKDDKGNTVYNYSGYWDFSKPLEIDPTPSEPYTSSNPVVTLYAAWVRQPSIEIYDIVNGEEKLVATYEIKNATLEGNNVISLPGWNKAKQKYEFGALADAILQKEDGGTTEKYPWTLSSFVKNESDVITSTVFFEGLCLDSERQNMLQGSSFVHPFIYDDETATITNPTLKLYISNSTKDGEWYRIYSAKEFASEAKRDSNLEIMQDLEFSALQAWPNALRNNDFEGTILGNGHKISGVTINSTTGASFGMFKSITKDAVIKDLTLENVTATIKSVYIKPGARYAILASTIEDGFEFENVSFENMKLQIHASASSIVTADYEIGLVCAEGYSDTLGVDISKFGYEVIESESDIFVLNITKDADQNRLLLEFIAKEQN